MIEKFLDDEKLQKMRYAGTLAAQVLEMIEPHIKAGVTTNHLNEICHNYMVNELQCIPAPLGYRGFPKSICTSANRVVCHGIPNDKPLKNGDILNIDVSLSKDGFFSDTNKTYFVGEASILAKRIVKCAQHCAYSGIALVAPGVNLRTIGNMIERCARSYGYSVVHEFCGHGIGTKLHQDPQVLHYDHPESERIILEQGMTFTIEPMINVGKRYVRVLKDGWTVVTKDHSLSAQFEHTILVTHDGFEVLTLRRDESIEEIMQASRSFG